MSEFKKGGLPTSIKSNPEDSLEKHETGKSDKPRTQLLKAKANKVKMSSNYRDQGITLGATSLSKSKRKQRADYQDAISRRCYDEIVKEIARYDAASPRINPQTFVNHLCSTYEVDSASAIRIVQKVRAIKALKET